MNHSTSIAHLFGLILVSGWTAAWLMWLCRANLLSLVFSRVAPARWLSGVPRAEIQHYQRDVFVIFLCGTSQCPYLLRKHLSCERCLAASIAVVGYSTLLLVGPAPLAIASAAWLAACLHQNVKN